LLTLYNEELAKKEKERFKKQRYANADFVHWAKTAHWTVDEAIAKIMALHLRQYVLELMKQRNLMMPLNAIYQTTIICRYKVTFRCKPKLMGLLMLHIQ
jgi:hypothetical protein